MAVGVRFGSKVGLGCWVVGLGAEGKYGCEMEGGCVVVTRT